MSYSTRAVTATGQLLGTIGYMAPEQARNGRDLMGSADVFSLGCVLFECLTGQRAFPGEWVMEVLTKVLQHDPPRLGKLREGIPQELDELVVRMMAKRPEDRPPLSTIIATLAPMRSLSLVASPLRSSLVVNAHAARPAITHQERRLLAYVLADDQIDGHRGESGPTIAVDGIESTARLLGQSVFSSGGQLGTNVSGSPLVTVFNSGGMAVDLAVRAARCSLALRQALPHARIAVTLGSMAATDDIGKAEGIDHAEQLLKTSAKSDSTPAIFLDPTIAGLLDRRFEMKGEAPTLLLGEREWGEPVPSPSGRPLPFVGRERELSLLRSMAEECMDEPLSSVVLVMGSMRIGKSRLLREFLKGLETREPRIKILKACAEPVVNARPLSLLGQLLARLAGVTETDMLAVRLQKLEAFVKRRPLPRTVGQIDKEMLELLLLHAGDGATVPELVRQDADKIERIAHAFAAFIDAETAIGPVVLVLDDLQWSDAPSVRAISTVLRLLQQRPLLVLAAARPELHDLFPKLWSERYVREIRLVPLTPNAARRLVLDALGEYTARDTVDTIVEAAGGIPYYIEELVRASARGEGESAALVAVAQANIERLSNDQRRLLRAASIFGQNFFWGGMVSLLGEQEAAPLRAALLALLQQELVIRVPTPSIQGQEEFTFRSALVKSAAYKMLTPTERKAGHRRAAEWLEASGARDALMLADHLANSDESQGAIVWYLWSAEQALTQDDLSAVQIRAERGVACGAQGAMLGELRLLEAEAAEWSGKDCDAAFAREALTLLSPGMAAWCRAAACLAVSTCRKGQAEMIEELAALSIDSTVGAGHALAMARVAIELLFAGRAALAERIIRWVKSCAKVVYEEDRPTLGLLGEWLHASLALYAGNPAAMREKASAITRGLHEIEQHRLCAIVAIQTSIACAMMGDYEGGLRMAQDAREITRKLGYGVWANRAELLSAVQLFRLGRIKDASVTAGRAEKESAAAGDVVTWEHAHAELAAIRLAEAGGASGANTRTIPFFGESKARGATIGSLIGLKGDHG